MTQDEMQRYLDQMARSGLDEYQAALGLFDIIGIHFNGKKPVFSQSETKKTEQDEQSK